MATEAHITDYLAIVRCLEAAVYADLMAEMRAELSNEPDPAMRLALAAFVLRFERGE